MDTRFPLVASHNWLDFSIGFNSMSLLLIRITHRTLIDEAQANGSGRKPASYNGCYSIRLSTGIMDTEGVVGQFVSLERLFLCSNAVGLIYGALPDCSTCPSFLAGTSRNSPSSSRYGMGIRPCFVALLRFVSCVPCYSCLLTLVVAGQNSLSSGLPSNSQQNTDKPHRKVCERPRIISWYIEDGSFISRALEAGSDR